MSIEDYRRLFDPENHDQLTELLFTSRQEGIRYSLLVEEYLIDILRRLEEFENLYKRDRGDKLKEKE